MLALEDITLCRLTALWPELTAIPARIVPQIEADCRYAGYLRRQQADIEALARDDAINIPADFDYHAVGGLSAEARDVMIRLRPRYNWTGKPASRTDPGGGCCCSAPSASAGKCSPSTARSD